MHSTGLLFAILTGLFFGLQGFYGKKVSTHVPPLMISWGSSFFSLPYLLIVLAVDGWPLIIWKDFLWSAAICFIINSFAWYFFFRALQMSPLAHTMPFTAFTPLFLIPVAFLLLGEIPDSKGVMGIICIFAGGYSIHLEPGKILSPLRNLGREPGTRLMLLVAILWSVTASAEKVAVLSSSQALYGSLISFLLSMVYIPLILRKVNYPVRLLKTHFRSLLLLGLISGLTLLFQFTALKFLLVSYVISFKRAGIIVSVLLGILIYREKNALKNLTSTLIMILGVFLILI